jgi:hypothetical protein
MKKQSKFNVKIPGTRERIYYYVDQATKKWLKQQAKKNNVSLSHFINTMVLSHMNDEEWVFEIDV